MDFLTIENLKRFHYPLSDKNVRQKNQCIFLTVIQEMVRFI